MWTEWLVAVMVELEGSDKATDDSLKKILRNLSLYGRPPAVDIEKGDPMNSAICFYREMKLFSAFGSLNMVTKLTSGAVELVAFSGQCLY